MYMYVDVLFKLFQTCACMYAYTHTHTHTHTHAEDCWSEDDTKYTNWKKIKQSPLRTNEQINKQLKEALVAANNNLESCSQGFSFDKKKVEICHQAATLKLCNKYGSLAQVTDFVMEQCCAR